MNRLLLELGILATLLAFEIWNVSTARKRGRVFMGLRPIIKSVEPKDFRTAIILRMVWIFVIVIIVILRIVVFYCGRAT